MKENGNRLLDNQEKVGKFIAKLRKEKNITQSQLADKLGTNVKTISRWETGATLFDISYLKQLCDIFEINELELLKGERLIICRKISPSLLGLL